MADMQVGESTNMEQDAGVPLAELRLRQEAQDTTRPYQTQHHDTQQSQDLTTQRPTHQSNRQAQQPNITQTFIPTREANTSATSYPNQLATLTTIDPPGQPSPQTDATVPQADIAMHPLDGTPQNPSISPTQPYRPTPTGSKQPHS